MKDAALSSSLIRQDIVPMTAGFALLMGALAVGLWLTRRAAAGTRDARTGQGQRPAPGPGPAPGPAPGRAGWWRLARHVLGTYLAGYLLLMAVDVGYYYGVARVRGDFIESAFTGSAMLIGLSAPVFLALTWLSERWRSGHGEGK